MTIYTVRGKRKIEAIQAHVESARLHINSVSDQLLVVLNEGPAKLTDHETSDLLERLIMADDAIREAKIALDV